MNSLARYITENAVRETTALATKADKAVNRLQEDLAKLKEAESAE